MSHYYHKVDIAKLVLLKMAQISETKTDCISKSCYEGSVVDTC